MATENRILEDGSNLITMSGDNRVIQQTYGSASYSYTFTQEQTANALRRAELNNNVEFVIFLDADRLRNASIDYSIESAIVFDADRVVFNSFSYEVINRVIESGDNRLVESGDNRILDLGNYLATSNITFMATEVEWDGGIFYNNSGQWKAVDSFVRVNGQWEQANAYQKINGNWKRIN